MPKSNLCPRPPNEKGGHNWNIIGDPPWTIKNMAVQKKQNCKHHNGKMGQIVSMRCGKKKRHGKPKGETRENVGAGKVGKLNV